MLATFPVRLPGRLKPADGEDTGLKGGLRRAWGEEVVHKGRDEPIQVNTSK
ncbi:hypothetical protein WN55_08007 [Dufourea novaeangliae]|uniref:Uncharacterized protein n=1 Tax=Dufourea novaeangliae TaxID=178035 RepID=A0A154P733_DUFNO|nr:hypothetical protein WN55_08007 [Dufourea novaeangliae]